VSIFKIKGFYSCMALVLMTAMLASCTSAATPTVEAPSVPEATEVVPVPAEPATAVPATEAVAFPTPVATGLAEYTPPSGGLLEEIKKRGVLKNGVECQNPPGEFFDTATNQCTGYSIELAQIMADKLGVKLETIDTAWSGVIPSLYTRNFDMILSSMTITDARKKAVSFSDPVGCDQVVWITRKGDNRITEPKQLDGMTVATQLNSAAETQTQTLEKELGIKYAKVLSFDHFDGSYLAVKTKQADIATSTMWNNIPLFKAEPETFDVAFKLPIFNYVGVAIRQQDQDMLKFVNDTLAELEANGKMADLQYKYYGYGMTCGDPGPNTPADWTPPAQ
jgi:polar amino acid transport system substrate-binding protein